MSEAGAGRFEDEPVVEAAAGHLRSTRSRRYRWLGAILVVVWLLPLVLGATAAIRLLF